MVGGGEVDVDLSGCVCWGGSRDCYGVLRIVSVG